MEILRAVLLSFAITVISTPITIYLAKKYGFVDDPSKRPHPAHIQERIIPRAGGIPIYIGIVISSLLLLPLEKHLFGIFIGISILLILGLLDDRLREFSPYTRLLLISLSAAAAVASGIGITFITNPLHPISSLPPQLTEQILRLDQIVIPFTFIGYHKILLLADIFAFFLIITITQIINWSKGVDGQMPGITTITAFTIGLLSLKFFYQGDPNQLNLAILSFIVGGTSLGFLIFNWYPSKILPGFSASTILAYVLACLSILSGAKVATLLLVLAIPTIDFLYTFFRRIFQGRSPVWGDRGHLHHRLLDLGWSHRQISLFYMGVSAILGSAGLFIETSSKIFIVLLVSVVFFGFALWLNSFGVLSRRSDRDNG